MTKLEILKKVFGYQEFRPGQVEAIDALISGKDTIVIIPVEKLLPMFYLAY